VKETHWYFQEHNTGSIIYKATKPERVANHLKWRPSIFMPRWACRLILEIIDIRVERVQSISEQDAIAEGTGYGFQMNAGWPNYEDINKSGICNSTYDDVRMSFASLWDTINKKRGYGWDKNPYVWVLEYKIIKP
jgi:hypothetical protein